MNNLISLDQAIAMTTLYRAQKDNILSDAYKGKNVLPISETFDRDAFQAILDQPACVSVRIYYSMSDDLTVRSIIVGVNADNEDLLPENSESSRLNSMVAETAGTTPPIVELGILCPPQCPPPSKLNP